MRLILNIVLILLAASCVKKGLNSGHNKLPTATTKGKGMFACYINNDTYIARRITPVSYNPETGYLFMENGNNSFEFRLFVYSEVFGKGDYTFDDTGEEWVNRSYTEFYGLQEGGINNLLITRLDVEEKIISGHFNVDLIAEDNSKKQVRDGRFDLTLNIIE